MRILITGISGFVAGHLLKHLAGGEYKNILGIDNDLEKFTAPEDINKFYAARTDITDREEVKKIISTFKPQQAYHLAAQSAVGYSWKEPEKTFEINVFGSMNILEEIKNISPYCRILMICTSEIYDRSYVKNSVNPVSEDTKIYPRNPYAISKATMDFYSSLYYEAYNLPVLVSRSFNHIGPGQSTGFVTSDFASQIARIEKGLQKPEIFVGNLEASRDFLDVRDVVCAYYCIMNKGRAGQAYNVCSGKAIKISEILQRLLLLSTTKNIGVIKDKNKFRPVEVASITGDNKKLISHTGWKPVYDIEDSLKEILGYWRENV